MGVQKGSCVRMIACSGVQHPEARWERLAVDWVRTGVCVRGSNVQVLRLLRSEHGASAVGAPWETCACTYALITVLPWYPLTHHLCRIHVTMARFVELPHLGGSRSYLRQLASSKEKVCLLLLFCFH
jgi:hypothetical protein